MLTRLSLITLIVITAACANQGGQNATKSAEAPERDRVDEAFNDGRCSSTEARRGNSPDCEQQASRKSAQREPLAGVRDRLDPLSGDELDLDRTLPDVGNQGLLRR